MHPTARKFFTLPAAAEPFFLAALIMSAPISILTTVIPTSGTPIILTANTTGQSAKPKPLFSYKSTTLHFKLPDLFTSIINVHLKMISTANPYPILFSTEHPRSALPPRRYTHFLTKPPI
jgi:hypothetical protein